MRNPLKELKKALEKKTVTYRGTIVGEREEPIPYFPNPEKPNELRILYVPRHVVRTEDGDKLVPLNSGLNEGDEVLVTEIRSVLGSELRSEKI